MMNGGTVIRDDHESQWHGEGPSPFRPAAKSVPIRSHPGILIFSRGRQLLHMNRRALELTSHLNETEVGPANHIPLASMHELRTVIQKTLDHRKEVNLWESFELESAVFDVARKILVRGFGIADRNSYDDSRIVIVLDDLGLRGEQKDPQPSAPVFHCKVRCAVS